MRKPAHTQAEPDPPRKIETTTEWGAALLAARALAIAGPRVAAVLEDLEKRGTFAAVPGFMDRDTTKLAQVALVTPDGRIWVLRDRDEWDERTA